MSNKEKKQLHIISIPTPELKMKIYEIRRQNDKNNTLLNQYRHIIEENLLSL